MYARTDFLTPRTYMCSRRCWPFGGRAVAYQLYYAKRRDIFDEFARENLRTTDSICLKSPVGAGPGPRCSACSPISSGIVVGVRSPSSGCWP